MRKTFTTALVSLVLVGCTSTQGEPPLATAAPAANADAAQPASLADLVSKVDIPYESFTLPNGLTTIVHTDRKAPLVGVTVYYRVGSKHEPRGRTGFAHLFEHLMFGGSENVPNFDIPLEAAGSTSTNGSTWYDRTNYVETVPTGALDLALFMESDRMGHLLGAVTQDKLDKQRGVVQNEKRQGDNQPYGLADYAIGEGLLPVGHPYRHSTIGSMADLDAASLADVRKWFTDNYGPNNVVLVLAGDIDTATAREKVTKWFGDIPRGPDVAQPAATATAPAATVKREMADQVPATRIYRAWTGPGLNDADSVPLTVGMHVLGGLDSSRLDKVLVREEQLATRVAAYAMSFEQMALVQVEMDLAKEEDRARAEQRLDALIAEMIANGPTEDELRRAATQIVSSELGKLEDVGGFGGKGSTLAEGELYSRNPAQYKADLERAATLTPAAVREAMQRWLTRPGLQLAVVPGERTEDGATMGGWGDENAATAPAVTAITTASADPAAPSATVKRAFPEVAPVGDLTFPAIERATLSNGIPVSLARRTAIPKLSLSLEFDAGQAADGAARAGTQSLMMDMLEEGTTTRSALDIAEQQERLGAWISTGTRLDSSAINMTALSANIAPSLELMADMVRNPAFDAAELERVKAQREAEIEQSMASPMGLAQRAINPLIFGPAHPYGSVGSLGEVATIAAITPATLQAEHDKWLRPDTASITVVGDITMAQLLPALERAFGNWQAPASARPAKDLTAAIPAAQERIVVIDRPNSPQSVLLMARVLPMNGTAPGMESLELANEVIGAGFLSRLNTQLREEKGWTYGIRAGISAPKGPRTLTVFTPVQSDRTADSIRLILDEMRAFPGTRGVDATELQRVTDGNARNLPNRFQTNDEVMNAIVTSQRLNQPDDYYVKLPSTYRAIDAAAINNAARTYLQPNGLTIVVVGDRKVIDAQLAGLGLPITYETVDTDVSNAE